MKDTTLARSFESLLPLIILVLFFAVPYFLKALGRHGQAGREDPRKGATPPLTKRHLESGEQEHDTMRWPDAGHSVSGVPDNKPIHPKWF